MHSPPELRRWTKKKTSLSSQHAPSPRSCRRSSNCVGPVTLRHWQRTPPRQDSSTALILSCHGGEPEEEKSIIIHFCVVASRKRRGKTFPLTSSPQIRRVLLPFVVLVVAVVQDWFLTPHTHAALGTHLNFCRHSLRRWCTWPRPTGPDIKHFFTSTAIDSSSKQSGVSVATSRSTPNSLLDSSSYLGVGLAFAFCVKEYVPFSAAAAAPLATLRSRRRRRSSFADVSRSLQLLHRRRRWLASSTTVNRSSALTPSCPWASRSLSPRSPTARKMPIPRNSRG